MSLQIPSGVITAVSGAGSVDTIITYPTPVTIVAAGSGANFSGQSVILHYSGALNVNISGGALTTITVTSGGSVYAGWQSGILVGISGVSYESADKASGQTTGIHGVVLMGWNGTNFEPIRTRSGQLITWATNS